ncbi:unnamed protein product [Arctia plantaginis]|uniref:Uncharacterized protein n=1 Tax=Arctia plantaginis TaxID=874455 RepID=A0A8S1AKT3_ARCPL|nr:unnamed protein product [Arctia plantaginis]
MADPIAVLQSRIEQLEAKLGLAANSPIDGQQGDSATANLLNTAQGMNNAIAGHEKLAGAMQMATELNNYTDPNYIQNLQDNQMRMQEVAAAEPTLQHHCQCMHRCKQAAAVLESEPIQHAPQMQEVVNNMQAAAAEVKVEAEQVTHGVQELAETCGAAANEASQQLADVAQKVEQVEQKMFPRRRNGLD